MIVKEIDTKLGPAEYSSSGQGIPVLFLHGGHSNCHDVLGHKGFDQRKYQLITPSRPGYGRTPLGNNKTPKQAAALILELLNSLSIERTIVYGISAGGPTAIEFAANYPDRVLKLVLASAVSKKWLDKKDKTYKVAQKMFHPSFEKYTWSIVRFFSSVLPKLMAQRFYPEFSRSAAHQLDTVDIKELIRSMKCFRSKTGFLNDLDQTIEPEVLKSIKSPTLIIHSQNDNSVPVAHAHHAKEMISNAQIELLDNEWGHLFWIGIDSNESIEKITGFIAD